MLQSANQRLKEKINAHRNEVKSAQGELRQVRCRRSLLPLRCLHGLTVAGHSAGAG